MCATTGLKTYKIHSNNTNLKSTCVMSMVLIWGTVLILLLINDNLCGAIWLLHYITLQYRGLAYARSWEAVHMGVCHMHGMSTIFIAA